MVDGEVDGDGQPRRNEVEQHWNQHVGDAHAHDTGKSGKEETLSEQLSHDLLPAGTERRPHGDFLLPARRPCEEQAGHIRAHDEEHEYHGPEQGEGGGFHQANVDLRPGQRDHAPASVLGEFGPVFLLDPARDRCQLRVHVLEAVCRADARENLHLSTVSRETLRTCLHRNPHVTPIDERLWRHDADERVRLAVHGDGRADRRRGHSPSESASTGDSRRLRDPPS